MRRVVVDTNVLVSFLTDRDAEQQALAAALFEASQQGEIELLIHQMVIGEMVYVLDNLYRIERREIAQLLIDLLALPRVRTVDRVPWSQVLASWPRQIPDFADAVLVAATLAEHHDTIATFDRRFIARLRGSGLISYWDF